MKKRHQPIVIDTTDTTPQEVKGVGTIKFQSPKNDPSKVRAVLMENGTITIRGDVVPKENAFASRLGVLSQLRERNYNRMNGLRDDATREEQLKDLEKKAMEMFGGFNFGGAK